MKNIKDLHILLDRYQDLPFLSYKIQKQKLGEGLEYRFDHGFWHNIRKEKVIETILVGVVKVLKYSSQFSNDKNVRDNLDRIILFKDEMVSCHLNLKDFNRRIGLSNCKVESLFRSDFGYSLFYIDDFFYEQLKQSQNIVLELKIEKTGILRKDFENQSMLLQPDLFVEQVLDSEKWLKKIDSLIAKEQFELIYTRSSLWGYDNNFWDNNIGIEMIDFAHSKLKLQNLPFKDINHINYITKNFMREQIKNEELLLAESVLSKNEKIISLINNISKKISV